MKIAHAPTPTLNNICIAHTALCFAMASVVKLRILSTLGRCSTISHNRAAVVSAGQHVPPLVHMHTRPCAEGYRLCHAGVHHAAVGLA
jgi:hypothetical protein